MFIAQSIMLAFESEALWRGANNRRFLHLVQAVEYTVRPLPDNAEIALAPQPSQLRSMALSGSFLRRNQYKAEASHLEVKSGFFVKQQSAVSVNENEKSMSGAGADSVSAQVFVHVNEVELKQKSALALAWLGRDLGTKCMQLMLGPLGKLFSGAVYIFVWLILMMLPWIDNGTLPQWIPLLALLSLFGLAFRNLMISSKSLLTLLITRRHFLINLVFLTIWLVLICLVFKDERAALAFFMFTCAIFELLVDALLTIPGTSGPLSRKWEKINLAFMFAVLSAFMVFGQIQNPFLYLVFRPDLLNNSTINSDSWFTIFFHRPCVNRNV